MNADKLAQKVRQWLGPANDDNLALEIIIKRLVAGHDAQPAQAAQPGDDEAARRYIRDWCPDHVKDLIDRVAAQPVGVPDGWVMVPRGPTNDMVLAGIGAWSSQHANAIDIWHAMLAAAPQPPAQPSADADVYAELDRAIAKFPTWPTDPLHALAVLGEEYGELTQTVLQHTYEPHKSALSDALIDYAKMAKHNLRFLREKNLACWCRPGTPCHADVLLELANV